MGAALDGDSVLAHGMAALARGYLRSPDQDRPVIDTAVKEPARSMVRRIYRRFSMACACSSTGSVRGAPIQASDAGARQFSSTFCYKVQAFPGSPC